MKYIFIHGLGQDPSSWNKVTSYLAEQDNVICLDLSIFLKAGDGTYKNLYKAFTEYCDSISGPLNLCGLSLGAIIALNYAIEKPGKVKSIVL